MSLFNSFKVQVSVNTEQFLHINLLFCLPESPEGGDGDALLPNVKFHFFPNNSFFPF